jgi:hypothetical protein
MNSGMNIQPHANQAQERGFVRELATEVTEFTEQEDKKQACQDKAQPACLSSIQACQFKLVSHQLPSSSVLSVFSVATSFFLP